VLTFLIVLGVRFAMVKSMRKINKRECVDKIMGFVFGLFAFRIIIRRRNIVEDIKLFELRFDKICDGAQIRYEWYMKHFNNHGIR
jgi:hypothetical protein